MTEFGFARIIASLDALSPIALQVGAEHIGSLSDDQAPKDSGDLIGSREVEVDDNEAVISYNTKYAHRQHEDLSYQHPGGGNAKFLELAALTGAGEVFDIIAATLREAF